jgi:glucose/arabinose dehydrogenase
MMPRTVWVVAGLLVCTLPAQTPLTVRKIASGLLSPVFVTAPAGDEHRLFVVECLTGLVKILADGQLLSRPFLDLSDRSRGESEQGLFCLAFHPRYATNGYCYVKYCRAVDGAVMIERYTVAANDPNVVDQLSAMTILGPIAEPFFNHNGGCLKFGPDGYLYIGMGDGGGVWDPFCSAQKPDTLLGKMLRIDVDGGVPYAIPNDNPFVNQPGYRPEIWHTGWRNPWRFSFDRATGDLYVGDVGQDLVEEISFQPANSKGGQNYGWKLMEGSDCGLTNNCPPAVPACQAVALTNPIYEYRHLNNDCSVTGGYVYRGCAIPDLRGTYFFGDWCTGRIWSFRYSNGQLREFRDRTPELNPGFSKIHFIASFGEDSRGEIYVISYLGDIWKIVPNVPPFTDDLGFATDGSNGRAPVMEVCGLLDAGNAADFLLYDADAPAVAVLLVSGISNPRSFWNGTLVPDAPFEALPFITLDGKLSFNVRGGIGPLTLIAQFLVLDPFAPNRLGFSNALRVRFP